MDDSSGTFPESFARLFGDRAASIGCTGRARGFFFPLSGAFLRAPKLLLSGSLQALAGLKIQAVLPHFK